MLGRVHDADSRASDQGVAASSLDPTIVQQRQMGGESVRGTWSERGSPRERNNRAAPSASTDRPRASLGTPNERQPEWPFTQHRASGHEWRASCSIDCANAPADWDDPRSPRAIVVAADLGRIVVASHLTAGPWHLRALWARAGSAGGPPAWSCRGARKPSYS